MGEHQQYRPSKDEFLLTGLFGAALYIFLATIILSVLLKHPKNKFSKVFFVSMLLVCLFEIPRFLSIAITTNYQSKLFYIFHLFSSIFFFGAFTIVCLQWSSLLKLGTYVSIIYSFKGVLISNLLFILIDIIAMIVCGLSSSLHSFFRSTFFEWFTFLDTFKNLLYSSLLFFYGFKLILKFYRYNSLEISYHFFQTDLTPTTTSTSASAAGSASSAALQSTTNYGQRKTAFGIALKKLTIVLFVTTICFFVRVMMLIVKLIALRGDLLMSSPTIPLFGFVWFLLSDWIPRCIPSFAFVYLMNMKRSNLKRGGNTEGLLKGAFMRQPSPLGSGESNGHPFAFHYDDDDDDDDDFSSLNDPEGGENFDDDEYLTESRYSDDLTRPYPLKPYEWSEGSEDNVYVGDGVGMDDEEQVVFLNQGGRGSSGRNQSSSGTGRSQKQSSQFSFLNRNHYSWTALSSGFSFGNLTNAGNTSSKASETSPQASSAAAAPSSSAVSVESDDISMTSFTSLAQLTPKRRSEGASANNNSATGRVSPQQKNDGYNNTEVGPIRSQRRSVEL
jgi:hypothetical protein